MATTAGTVLASVLSRIRDPQATMMATGTPATTASGQTLLYSLISYAQQLVNCGERLLISNAILFLATNTPVYDFSLVLDYSGAIVSVSIAGIEIDGPVDYTALGRTSRSWQTDTGAVPLSWGTIGHTLLFLYPATVSTSPQAVVRYLNLPKSVALPTDDLSVPDDTVEHVARLTALVCRLKTRQLTGFADELKSLMADMQVEETAEDAIGGKAD